VGFVVKQSYEYEWPVDVKVPSAKTAGHFDVQRFTGLFKTEPVEKATERLKELSQQDAADFATSLLNEVWLGWREGQVTDDAGSPLPNTPENRATLMQWSFVRQALLEAYQNSNSGVAVKKRQAGN
jgi:hypothetical protein